MSDEFHYQRCPVCGNDWPDRGSHIRICGKCNMHTHNLRTDSPHHNHHLFYSPSEDGNAPTLAWDKDLHTCCFGTPSDHVYRRCIQMDWIEFDMDTIKLTMARCLTFS